MKKRRENLGNFELMVLLAVMRLKDEAYGLPILEEIETCIGREVALGSVYAALSRLESKGFVSCRLWDPTPNAGGKAKRYIKVTAGGMREAISVRRALVSLWRELPEAGAR